MDHNKANQALLKFADVANELGVTWFLVGGTCLGIVRDGDYILGDDDVDVGILCNKDELLKLFGKLEAHFKYEGVFTNPDNTYNLHFWKDAIGRPHVNVLLDIFFIYTKGERTFFNSFDEVTFLGRKFNVPHPVDNYLTHCFGNWRVKSDSKFKQTPGRKVKLEDILPLVQDYGMNTISGK